MSNRPLCLHCHQPIEELRLVLEGQKVRYCLSCTFDTYQVKTEALDEKGSSRAWEESPAGLKRHERVWWQWCRDKDCVKGWDELRERQCWTCQERIRLAQNAQLHRSGALKV